jgi:hypothetical protein
MSQLAESLHALLIDTVKPHGPTVYSTALFSIIHMMNNSLSIWVVKTLELPGHDQ